jgi:hypothetical protein
MISLIVSQFLFTLFFTCKAGAAFHSIPFHRYRHGATLGRPSPSTSQPLHSTPTISVNEPEEGQQVIATPTKKRTIRKPETKDETLETSAERQTGERNNYMFTVDGHRIAYTEYLFDNSNEVVVCK